MKLKSILYCLSTSLCILIVIFLFLSLQKPEEVKLEPVGDPIIKQDESQTKEKASSPEKDQNHPKAIPEPDTIIVPETDGEVDENLLSAAKEQIKLIPDDLQEAFNESGWKIYITDEDINATYYSGKFKTVMATTNYSEKRILIENKEKAIRESLIHEVGHWFDYQNGFPSNADAFKNIYAKEADAFIKAYQTTCVRDPMEFFAEGFWQYIITPSKLQLEAPNLYEFIKQEIRSF